MNPVLLTEISAAPIETPALLLLVLSPPFSGRVGRPRRRPDSVVADRGYDHDKYRRLVWQRGIKPLIARRQTEHGSGLGRHCWVVERTFAWMHNRRRLLVRTDRSHKTHEAFLSLCCLICWQRLETSFSQSLFSPDKGRSGCRSDP